ncbi:hypothetical protein EII40_08330 [Tannerella forsythia]|uniref:Uncharacterized protein n=1 Tax=Tannerella forsythia TaxID=28112 RepID=A0A3P1XPL8_TANFO|nr:hypothetical protein EII40_08330 [Tannerella forsythia]
MFITLTIGTAIIILAICVVLLCVRVILKRDGHFPNTHIDSSPALREQGIYCARTQDRQAARHKNLAERMKEMNIN